MKDKKIALVFDVFDNDGIIINNYIKKFIKSGICLEKVFLFSQQYIDIDLISFPNVEMIKSSKFKKAKFETFAFLNIFDVVIYSNSDSFFVDNLNNIDDYSLCLLRSDNNYFVEKYLKKKFKSYSMFLPAICFDFFIVTKKMSNYNVVYRWITHNSLTYSSYFRNRIDGILNIMLQKFDFSIYYLNLLNNSSVQGEKKIMLEKKKFPLVSVLMSVYDRCDYLDEAINSILSQTYDNFEFIIVVEFSEMQKEILKKISNYKDDRIKIISNKKKLGFSESLNVGLKAAKGKYLARMDDDDISDVCRFEKQVSFLEQNQDIDVLGSYMKFFDSSDAVCKLPFDCEILKVKCLYKTPVFHPTVMLRLDSMKKNRLLYHKTYAEDYDLWSRAIKYLKFSNFPEVLYYYRFRDDNHSVSNEFAMNDSHHNIMSYQLREYLGLRLSFDELQILSGRIDVLGHSENLDFVYNDKISLWNKIRKANKKCLFYKDSAILSEIEEIQNYYYLLKELRKR